METKLFEIRDRATIIPVMAIQLGGRDAKEKWLLGQAGFSADRAWQEEFIILCIPGETNRSTYNPFDWTTPTMHQAHLYIMGHWPELRSGAVIDVEYLLGLRPMPTLSEFSERETVRGWTGEAQ